ncbi:MAG: hypothetical protein HOA17_09215 [Candidatus Melainabacteria bacterium]|jgi:hypothetical protein|nr:hypothetical protein [Candidatus Melainabacteria bacterium]
MKNLTLLQIGVALANLGVFGLLFLLMNYFELMGADTAYFDDGSWNNVRILQFVLEKLHLRDIVPVPVEGVVTKVSTLWYAACYGFAFAFAGLSIMIANRRSDEFYEVTN